MTRHLLDIAKGDWTDTQVLAARYHMRLTQADMAGNLGYSTNGYQKIEYGQSPLTLVTELAIRYLLEHPERVRRTT